MKKQKTNKFKSIAIGISLTFILRCTLVIQNLNVNINVNVINQNIDKK